LVCPDAGAGRGFYWNVPPTGDTRFACRWLDGGGSKEALQKILGTLDDQHDRGATAGFSDEAVFAEAQAERSEDRRVGAHQGAQLVAHLPES
jgi:hypothetical protein